MQALLEEMVGQPDAGEHLLPFLWLRGETHEKLLEELDRIGQCGVRSVCLESRTHDDFMGPGWWRDCDFLMEEAKRRGMTLWLLDDRHFPTGYANGLIESKYPHLEKLHLTERHIDVIGPQTGAVMLSADDEDGPAVRERLYAAVAYKRGGPPEELTGPGIDLTACVRGDMLYWEVPRGCYRIFFLSVGREGILHKGYLHPIDPASVDVLIEAVYEPHFRRYGAEFGKTFAGFFSDEPCFGNTVTGGPGIGFYDMTVGVPFLAMPWRADMPELLAAALGEDAVPLLPGLWYPAGETSARVRAAYMDIITGLYRDHFSKRLGDWCRARGATYIGHIIEDQNCHARLGNGPGHFFRALEGQDMAGIDVVLHQILPGMAHFDHTASIAGGVADTTFFNYMLAKLGASLSHLRPHMKGRALCEIFGAYGWAEGLPVMKWLIDHMLVRGINYFVPHAFTTLFPNPDCPPHFYAAGNNPQFRDFTRLMQYTGRMCRLFSGGAPVLSAGILYHAEAEWCGGSHMRSQEPARALYDSQLDYAFLSADDLQSAVFEDGALTAGALRLPCLIVPRAQILPGAVIRRISGLCGQGLPVFYVDGPPLCTAEGEAVQPPGEVCPLHELPARLLRFRGVRLDAAFPLLRVYHYVRGGVHLFLLFNEDMAPFSGRVALPVSGAGARLDLLGGVTGAVSSGEAGVPVSLSPYESCVLIFGDGAPPAPVRAAAPDAELTLERFDISLSKAGADFTPFASGAPLTDITGPDGVPDFCGLIAYETKFEAPAGSGWTLELGEVGETAHVWVNGTFCGSRICPPYRFDCSAAVKAGCNSLRIEAANSMAYSVRDGFSKYMMISASGVLGPVSLRYRS